MLVPILSIFNIYYLVNGILILTLILLITFQWLFIGYAVNLIYNSNKPEEMKLFSND
jgi:hypothetical protein